MGLESAEIILTIEERLGISIPNKRVAKLATVSDLEELVLPIYHHASAYRAKPLSDDDVRAMIRLIIAEQMRIDLELVKPDALLVQHLGIDA